MAGRGLGTLTLALAVQLGAFEKGLDKAGRDLDSKTRAMQQRMNRAGQQIGNALAVGFGVASGALALYVRNTIEAEKVQAQLAARIKDTGAAAGRTLQQLSAQADKLQSLTIFDDEAIGEAQAALLVFKDVQGLNFDRTIEAATDLATVMGTDVADAARLLGKALSDPIAGMGALRKAGIVLTEDQKFLIKALQESGDVAGAQAVILDQLAGSMGTAAEAARNTLGGALEGLKNSFNNMLEGDSGSDGVRGATEAINDLSAQMNSADVRAGFNAIVSGLASVAKFALQATAALTANSEANRQAGLDNAQRSYEGLLARRTEATDALKQNFLQRGIGDAFTSADKLKAEIADIDQRLEAARQKMRQAESQAARGPAPQIFAPDGTVTIHGDPDVFGSRPSSTGGGGGGRRDTAADDAKRAAEEAAAANKEFLRSLEDIRAEIGGPLQQVERLVHAPRRHQAPAGE
jgi:phage-related minor tail protein